MKDNKKIILIIQLLFISVFLCSCYDMGPIEDLNIITGIGYDVEGKGESTLIDTAEVISIKGGYGEGGAIILVGEGATLYSLVENRVSKQSKKIVFGAEVFYLISEERAELGIRDVLDDILRNPELNINAMVVVCKGKCEDFFSYKAEASTISEEVFRMIKLSYNGSFYSRHATVNDLLLMYNQQGREIFLPYIEISDGKPQLSGTVVFNNDKMIRKVSIKESKLINLLRNSGSKGVLSIRSDNILNFIDIHGENKVKVKVSKKNDQLKYDIFVNISAELLVDTLYEKELNKKQISKIEKLFEDKLEKDLYNQVNKIQKEYEIDCLDLRKYALAKYGRNSGYDSIDYFLSADIKVHPKVKINSIGRNHRTHIEDE